MQLRIASVFIIFVVSLAGVCYPFVLETKSDESIVLKTASAGVMLGLALLHLLPESAEVGKCTTHFLLSHIIYLIRLHFNLA
jgi:hypothetical protein